MNKLLTLLIDWVRREPAIAVAAVWFAASIIHWYDWSVALTVLLITICLAARAGRYAPAYALFAVMAALTAVVRLGLLA